MSGTTIPEIFAYGEYPTSKKLNDTFATKANVTDLTTVGTSITGLQTTVAGLVSVVGSGDSGALNTLGNRVTAVETDVAGVHTSITSLQTSVAGLSQSGSLPDDIQALSAALSAESVARANTDQGIVNAVATKQDALGFTPVEQIYSHKVKMGWTEAGNLVFSIDNLIGSTLWYDGNAPRSFTPNGYQKMPNGLILQWGTVVTSTGKNDIVLFPITFPVGALTAVATSANAASWQDSGTGILLPRVVGIESIQASSVGITVIQVNPAGFTSYVANERVQFFAVGI